jgi:hypothetical protein
MPFKGGVPAAEAKAMRHSNKLGAGAKTRKKLSGRAKIPVVMKEFARGTLHSGSGKIVPKSRPDIAKAIAMSEAGMSKK